MSNEYLYVFGYQDPRFQEADPDAESCGFFRITASSEQVALAWGKVLAAKLVQDAYGVKDPGSVLCADWIEHAPDKRLARAAARVPIEAEGEYPDFSTVRAELRL